MPLFGKKSDKSKVGDPAGGATASSGGPGATSKSKPPTVEDKYILKDVLGT